MTLLDKQFLDHRCRQSGTGGRVTPPLDRCPNVNVPLVALHELRTERDAALADHLHNLAVNFLIGGAVLADPLRTAKHTESVLVVRLHRYDVAATELKVMDSSDDAVAQSRQFSLA